METDAEQLEKREDVRLLQSARIANKGVVLDPTESNNELVRNGFSTASKAADDASTMTLKKAFREQIDGTGEETRKHMEEYVRRKLKESETDSSQANISDESAGTGEASSRLLRQAGEIDASHPVSGMPAYTGKTSEFRPVFQGITGLSEVPLNSQERLKIAEEIEAIRTGVSKPKPSMATMRRRG